MKILRILIIVMLICVLSCCSQKSATMAQLEDVEKALTVNADSAQNLFGKIDSADLRKENEVMMYDYLKNLITLEKNGHEHFNDSIVGIVYDYAQHQGDNHFKAKASFLQGIAYYMRKDYKQALTCQFDALAYLENSPDDPYLEGWINNVIALLYHDTFKPAPGIKYTRHAFDCFERIGNRHHSLSSRVLLLMLQHSVNHHDSVIQAASDIIKEAEKYKDESIRFDALTTLANTYVHNEQYDKGIEVFRILDEENLMTPYYEGEYIFALVLNGNLDIARERLNKTAQMPPFAQLVKAREVYFLAIGDTVNAYKQAAIINNWQSDVMANTFDDGIIDSVEESYQKDRELKAEKLRSANIIKWSVIICSAVILLLITGVGVWYYRHKIKLKNMELDLRMDEIRQLTDSVEDSRLQNRQMSEDISKLFKKQWGTLNMLCNEYFEKGENASLKATILTEVEKEIKRISGRDGLKSIEDALDRHFDGIISKLKQQLPGFDKKDIAFLTFSYAGFSPRAICLFTGFTIKYYYKKRAVLKDKILASDAPDKQLFVDLLG